MAEVRPAELRQRLLSAVVLATLGLVAAFLGGWTFAVTVAVGALLVAREWGSLVAGRHAVAGLERSAAMAAGTAAVAGVLLAKLGHVALGFLVIVTVALAASAFGKGRHWPSRWLGLGVVYVALTPMLLVWMREQSLVHVLFVFAVVWGSDSLAYFTGRWLGGPRLAPVWSPNKTWAGLLGAMVGAGLGGGAVAYGFGLPFVVGSVLLGAGLGVIAQAGDLFESRFKRLAHLKDSGLLIPGHGGALDRLDALMFVTPVFAVFVALHP